jgi:hypothetical protein
MVRGRYLFKLMRVYDQKGKIFKYERRILRLKSTSIFELRAEIFKQSMGARIVPARRPT